MFRRKSSGFRPEEKTGFTMAANLWQSLLRKDVYIIPSDVVEGRDNSTGQTMYGP